ncbi:MAG: acetyl-CoA carboxylase carboxyltransferase subunit beta [Planctomycetes bacterium]|nr:acetyl-CoA carboxylase carboxyltransferase subunit beta [Planctomycetota bacterium]
MAFSFFSPKRHVRTDGVFTKCRNCDGMVRIKDIEENLDVCPSCDFHFPIGSQRRIEITMDEGSWNELFTDIYPTDPLNFNAKKSYADRLKRCQQDTGIADAVITGCGKIGSKNAAVAVTDFRFMMGSMGSVVGEKIALLAEHAVANNLPLVIFSGSGGGARMDEGVISLMQMAKTSAALSKVHKAGLLYVSIITDPTYGGVSASFATLGDVIIAEPRARMGFTGPRVIQQTMKVDLPPGFQEAEFNRDHGQVDRIVHRRDIPSTLVQLFEFFRPRRIYGK